jgi:hypothetical protein
VLKVGTHVRALLAATVIGTLGGNAALLTQSESVAADQTAPTSSTIETTAAPTTVPLPDLAPVAFARVQGAGGLATEGGTCPVDALELSFDDPGPGWVSGAFVSPLGPAPTVWTTSVNGIVRCAGSHHAYLGFMALRTAEPGWDVELVPDVDLSHPEPPKARPVSHDTDDGPAKNKPDKAPKPKAAPATGPIVGKVDGPDIEGYARYEGQSTCDPAAKPGTLALRNLLLSRYPGTSSGGISRACDVGGKSEHKEGRAFDWGANVGNPAQRAAVDDFLRFLFATDSYGHQHALARRMGVMYVIWNQQIWHAYRADLGWQPYTGTSPHTDHVHISLSWAGARAETSYYSGIVVQGLPDAAGTPTVRKPRPPAPSTTTTRPPRQRYPGSIPSTTVPGDGGHHGGRDGRRHDGGWWSPPSTTSTTTVPSTTAPTTTSTTVVPAD